MYVNKLLVGIDKMLNMQLERETKRGEGESWEKQFSVEII